MRRLSTFVLGMVLVVPVVWGGELAGVTMDDQVTVNGKTFEIALQWAWASIAQ